MVTILVVEDDTALGRLYNTFLSKNGYTVIHTQSCQETVEMLADAIPSVVLLDLNLPDKSGLAIAHLMRTTPYLADIPIIVLSAIQPSPEEVTQYKIDHVLRKPVSLPILDALIKQVLAPNRDKVSTVVIH